MRALPAVMAEKFERFVEVTWCSRGTGRAKRRDALICGLGLCGLRWVEVSRMRLGDLSVTDGTLSVRSAKGGHSRAVEVGLSWVGGFTEVRRLYGDSTLAVFSTRAGTAVTYEQIRRRLRRWTKEVLGEEFSFHCLRHTAAVRVYDATKGDVVAVQRYLGHRGLQHTTVYLAGVIPAMGGCSPGFARGGSQVVVEEAESVPAGGMGLLDQVIAETPEVRTPAGVHTGVGSLHEKASAGPQCPAGPQRPAGPEKLAVEAFAEAVAERCECTKEFLRGWWDEAGKARFPFRLLVRRRDGDIKVACSQCGRSFGFVRGKMLVQLKKNGRIIV